MLAENALQERSPIPMETISFACTATEDHRIIACGIPNRLIDPESKSIIAAHPDSLAPFLTESTVDPRDLNVLDRRMLAQSRTPERILKLTLAVCGLIVIVAAAAALVRRATIHRDMARSLELDAMRVLSEVGNVHPATGTTPDLAHLLERGQSELASLQRTRIDPTTESLDGLSILERLEAALVTGESSSVRSLRITPTKVDVTLSATDRSHASEVASALAESLGWSAAPLSEGTHEGRGASGRRTFSIVLQPLDRKERQQ